MRVSLSLSRTFLSQCLPRRTVGLKQPPCILHYLCSAQSEAAAAVFVQTEISQELGVWLGGLLHWRQGSSMNHWVMTFIVCLLLRWLRPLLGYRTDSRSPLWLTGCSPWEPQQNAAQPYSSWISLQSILFLIVHHQTSVYFIISTGWEFHNPSIISPSYWTILSLTSLFSYML